MEPSQYAYALSKAMEFCSLSEKCISDIREKLSAWEVESTDSDRIIQELVKHRFIDEERYARAYLHDKLNINQWGLFKIKFLLKKKQIPDWMIETAIDEIDKEEYVSALSQLLSQKRKTLKSNSDVELNAKLIRFAQSRGFEYETITNALKQMNVE